MYVILTDIEMQQNKDLCEKYDSILAELDAKIERLAPPNRPNTNSYFNGIDKKKNPESWESAIRQEENDINEWIESGSDEWNAARYQRIILLEEKESAINDFIKKCEQRQFNELGGDLVKIQLDFKNQVSLLINALYQKARDFMDRYEEWDGSEIPPQYIIHMGGTRWKLDPDELQRILKNELSLHYKAVSGNAGLTKYFNDFIIDCILKNPHVAQSGIETTATRDKLKPIDKDVFSTSGKRVKKIEYPIDKVDNNIWNLLSTNSSGQLGLNFNMANSRDQKKGKLVPLYYSINFSEITDASITKQLTPFDKRVYIATAALYNYGNIVFSYSQIYAAMGNKNKPSKTDIKKIDESISKMAAARLSLNNQEEINAKYKYKLWKYDSSLLPLERIRSVINGTPVENAIHLFREPPLVSFAKERKQITTFDIQVLDTPISKTNQNIMIEDYLLETIASIRHKRHNKKICLTTIYEETNITTTKQKERALDKIIQVLKHYQKCGLINDYVDMDDEIIKNYIKDKGFPEDKPILSDVLSDKVIKNYIKKNEGVNITL